MVRGDDPDNQTPPFEDVDLVALDAPLRGAVAAFGGRDGPAALEAHGRAWGSAARAEAARLADTHTPRLRTWDARGRRIDRVEFHPAYHEVMAASAADGLHCSPWFAAAPPAPVAGGHLERAARLFVTYGVEAGHVCPMTMTNASVAALAAAPERLAILWPRLVVRDYDPRPLPFWEKRALTLGMGMTEKQGGSDVRANVTRATRASGDEWRLDGHKWFLSAPMSDLFLVLAQAPGGLTCFLLPRHRPDGAANGLHLLRLKDKLGNRSNASSEAEFHDAFAWRIGEEGRGVRTIIEMVQLTRLDCCVASAGLMRMGLARALHHARRRVVFQRLLVDQPAMRALLADLALEVEAWTALAMRLAAAFDRAAADPAEAAFARIVTPAAKFAICKAAPAFLYEAMEALGGNGYVEDSGLPRLYREAPVNAIWEGSGNVIALDVMRAVAREPEAAHALLARLAAVTRDLPGCPETARALADALSRPDEANARAIAMRLALLAAAAALGEAAPPEIAAAHARTRLAEPRLGPGTAALTEEARSLLERAMPEA